MQVLLPIHRSKDVVARQRSIRRANIFATEQSVTETGTYRILAASCGIPPSSNQAAHLDFTSIALPLHTSNRYPTNTFTQMNLRGSAATFSVCECTNVRCSQGSAPALLSRSHALSQSHAENETTLQPVVLFIETGFHLKSENFDPCRTVTYE